MRSDDPVVPVKTTRDVELDDSRGILIDRRLRVVSLDDDRVLVMVAHADAAAKAYALTPREGEVLLELLRRDSYHEIADALGIARSTVRTHAKQVFRKTGTRSCRALTLLVAFGIRSRRAKADDTPGAREALPRPPRRTGTRSTSSQAHAARPLIVDDRRGPRKNT